jgi:hypothetical protein
MDSTLRSVPADRPARIEAILERARQLGGAEIPVLASRGEGCAGERDRLQCERQRRRARAISIAIARSGLWREAGQLQAAAAAAVRSAAEREWGADRLRPLGLLFDAELSAADAILAVLLEDHLSVEWASLLRHPFERATTHVAATRMQADR